jgi:Ca2+-binding RTX toxin-like protein
MATIILTSNVIAENLAGPFRVGTLGIQDRPGEPFTFTLADHPVFEIVTADENGHAVYDLFVKSGVTFDYEAEPRRFEFSIEVRDGMGDPVEVDPVSIDVTNVNEAPTDIAMAGGSVPDNADLGEVVATLQAQDPDEGGAFTFTFVTDATGTTETRHGLFEIVDDTIQVKGALAVGTHNLWVKVTDSGNPALSYVKPITLTVTDANEPPEVVFEMSVVVEGDAGGTTVGTLAVTDPDASDSVGYSLVEIDPDGVERPSTMFRIDGNGNVIVRDGVRLLKVDGEDPRFTVKASDGTNTIYETFEVVLGENQEPTVSFDSEADLPKTIPGGTLLGTFVAEDPENDNVSYALVGGSNDLLRIDESGNVYVLNGAVLSYSNPTHRSFTVEWFDGINRQTENFSIEFGNEAPAVTLTSQAIMEGNPLNRVVGRVSAVDPEGDAIEYKLVGDNAALFDLVKTSAGYDIVLRPGIVLDYENENHQSLTVDVEVSDGPTRDPETATLAIDLTDVDEAPALTFFSRSVSEGVKGGTIVGRLAAVDPEGGSVSYELSPSSAEYFTLNEKEDGSCDVAVRSGVTLDYETLGHRSLGVTVFDGAHEISRTLALNLLDLVDRLTGTQRKDSLRGQSGSDIIKGLGGNDLLVGNGGADTLYGGSGKDILTGGGGQDVFVFDIRPSKTTNLDRLTDFDAREDSIWLDNKVFIKLGKAGSIAMPAQLSKSSFAIDRAKDKNDHLIYNKKSGVLSYDADGSGHGAAVEVAQLKKGLSLSFKDFFVV